MSGAIATTFQPAASVIDFSCAEKASSTRASFFARSPSGARMSRTWSLTLILSRSSSASRFCRNASSRAAAVSTASRVTSILPAEALSFRPQLAKLRLRRDRRVKIPLRQRHGLLFRPELAAEARDLAVRLGDRLPPALQFRLGDRLGRDEGGLDETDPADDDKGAAMRTRQSAVAFRRGQCLPRVGRPMSIGSAERGPGDGRGGPG